MTTIAPYLPPTFGGQRRGGNAVPEAPEPGGSFASLLNAAGDTSPDLLAPGAGAVPPQQLRSAIAQVFNEHGFFTPAPPIAPVEAEGPVAGPSPENVESANAVPARLGLPVQPAPGPSLDDGSPVAPQADLSGQAEVVAPGLAQQAPVSLSRGSGGIMPADAQLLPASGHPATFAAATVRSPQTEQETGAAGAAAPSEKPATASASEQAGRIVFRIAGHEVELMARLEKLSGSEEEHLLKELEKVLGEHGLSLASATVNGLALRHGSFGELA